MTLLGLNLRVSGHSSQGGRKYMEDALVIAAQETEDGKDLEYAFFGVYDGHGGKEAALFAKEHLMRNIVDLRYFWSDDDHLVLKAIRDGFMITHLAMWKEVENWPKTATGLPSTAGTTASIGFIRKKKLYIGHVGDSRIVLGYSNEGSKTWQSQSLTTDHKPDLPTEKKRIYNSGGLVMKKSGIDRVVWKRPRVGHQGPVRRSTDFDKIPFLAVARSLGDLWSYDFLHEVFVVSPEPDVNVITLDAYKDHCLIIGSDGLWNVLTPLDAVVLVQNAELENELASKLGASDLRDSLINSPAKVLVNSALEKWNKLNIRADNTSVITIIIDCVGPARNPLHQKQELRAMLQSKVKCNNYPAPQDQQNHAYAKERPPIHSPGICSINNLEESKYPPRSDYYHAMPCQDCIHDSQASAYSTRMTSSPLQSLQFNDNYPEHYATKEPATPKNGTDELENSPYPIPRWSKSASGQTSLSKLVNWSKVVNRRHLNEPKMTNASLISKPTYSDFISKRLKPKPCGASSSTVPTTYTPCSSFKECELVEQAFSIHRLASMETMKQISAFKSTIKRKYPGTDIIHCHSEEVSRDCTSPWKRKPIANRLSITALKAINEFRTSHHHGLKF